MFVENIRNIFCIGYMYPSLTTLGDTSTACDLLTTAQIKLQSDSKINHNRENGGRKNEVLKKKLSIMVKAGTGKDTRDTSLDCRWSRL